MIPAPETPLMFPITKEESEELVRRAYSETYRDGYVQGREQGKAEAIEIAKAQYEASQLSRLQ